MQIAGGGVRVSVGLVITFTLGLLAAPLADGAQQPGKVYRIGYLTAGGGVEQVFRDAMRQLGYLEGQHIVIEGRFAERKLERLPDLAAELVRLQVDVIVASLARPGGNVTGVTNNPGSGFTGKWLRLLKEAAPTIRRVATIHDLSIAPEARAWPEMQDAARTLRVRSPPTCL